MGVLHVKGYEVNWFSSSLFFFDLLCESQSKRNLIGYGIANPKQEFSVSKRTS